MPEIFNFAARMRILATLVLIGLVSLASCSKFAKVQKSNDYELKLKTANEYYDKKDYHFAQQLYEDLFPVMKGDPRFEDLYYKFAFCAYYQKDYMNAENLFKSFVEVFPTSKKAEEMEFMRGFSFYKQSPKAELDQTNTTRAIGLMQTFINTHPGSERNKEAMEIIEKGRQKLEVKEFKSAELYYKIGQFQAAAIAFTTLMNNYPDSDKSDNYKFQAIKSYYEYASLSVDSKKEQRYQHVITECNDFVDRFPESPLMKQVEAYSNISQNNIKAINNEQVKAST